MDPENITLKPLPPKIIICTVCTKAFLTRLRLNGLLYKTCDDCRERSIEQNRKYRKSNRLPRLS